MFDNLRKLLGRGVEAGALNRPQSAMGTLKGGTMGRAMGAARGAMQDARPFPQDPKYQGFAPEITVDPAQFGYPADDGQNGLQQAFRQPGNSLDALRKLLRF